MTQSRDQIETRLDELTAFIEEAAASVQDGKMVGLHHLDDEIAGLCDAAVALPPNEAARVQPKMATMIKRLEELANALKDYQQAAGNKGK